MPFELFVALRYLLARRKQAFISLISLISTIGVAVGVMALIIALALMTGLQGEVRDRILGSTAHIYVWKARGIADYRPEVQKLKQVDEVLGAAPAVLAKALAIGNRSEAFISIKGVDPVLEGTVTDIERAMIAGRLDALGHEGEDEQPGILLGKLLAEQLGASVGDTITLLTPTGTLSPMGMMPRSRRARVVGIYSLGFYEFDSPYGPVSLPFGERLKGARTGGMIQLRGANNFHRPRIAQPIP